MILKLVLAMASLWPMGTGPGLGAWDAAQQPRPPKEEPPPFTTSPLPPPVLRPPTVVRAPPAPPAPSYYRPPPPPPPPGSGASPARLRSGGISSDDYPAAAIRADAEGMVRALVTVSADGRVSDCVVTESAGNSALDSTTCSLIRRRFRYDPARTGSGEPRVSTISHRIIWRLPEDGELAFASGNLTWTVTASASAALGCTLNRNGDAFNGFGGLCPEEGSEPLLVDRTALPADAAPVRVTNVIVFVPEGSFPDAPIIHRSADMMVMADLAIEPDGRVSACEIVTERGRAPAFVRPYFPDLCTNLTTGIAVARDFATTARTRRARIQQLIYVEPAPEGAAP